MNAREHARTAERLLASHSPLRSPELNRAPELVCALVHAVLAVALRGDGSLGTTNVVPDPAVPPTDDQST